jgi:cytochrome c oxidase subunit 4
MSEEHVAEHTKTSRYIGTWVALLALTFLTFGVSFLPTGAWELPIALSIAVVKSVLVLLLFMHMLEQRFVSAFVLIVAVSLVVLLVLLVGADIATRHTFPRAPLHEVPPPTPNLHPPPPGGAASTAP